MKATDIGSFTAMIYENNFTVYIYALRDVSYTGNELN